MTTGKISQLHPMTPKDVTPRAVVSYEVSTLFGLPTLERFNPDLLASRKGLRIYAQMMEDEQVKAVMTFRLASITARGWEFKYDADSPLAEAERERRVRFYEHSVRELRGSFNDALMAVLRGHRDGFSLTEKVYDTIEFDGRPASGIVQLLAREPAWFRFFTDKFGTLVRCEQWIGNDKIEVDLKKFVHYVRDPATDRYYGQSDLRAAYRAWYMKDVILKLYGTYLERFAGGFAYAELPTEGSSLTTGNPEYTKLQDALTDMRNLASLILPPGVKLNVFQPSNSGEYREALTYLDLAIAKSVLVPNLLGLSHTGQTGAFAQSQTQLEAYFMTTANDGARLEDTLNEQLFKDLGDLNWGDGQYPRFCFKPASVEHVKWIVETWQTLAGGGVVMATDADEAHLRRLMDMPARTEDDSLLKQEQQDMDLEKAEAEAKLAPKPAAQPFTLDQLRAELDVRDAKLMASLQPSITLNTGLPPGPDGSTRRYSKDRTGAAAVRFHTPGGREDRRDFILDPDRPRNPRTLYVCRRVLNHAEISKWAGGQGFKSTQADDMHVTIAFSRTPVDWLKVQESWAQDHKTGNLEIAPGGPRVVGRLGDKGAIVLLFNSPDLTYRHEQIKECGATWQWSEYQPHITITYEEGPDLTQVEPYQGRIVLGPEIFEEVVEDWEKTVTEKKSMMYQHRALRSVDPITFANAAARVDFAVIEHRHELLSVDASEQLARTAARAVRRLLTPERVAELLDQDTKDIGELKLDSADVGRLKSGFKDALGRAWAAGQESAARELGKARQPVPATFATLRDNAADFFEANGFRMAANLSDGMRSIIQQELLLAVKNGVRPEHVIPRIYDRLIRKGFTSLLAVQREESRAEVLANLEELLADALGTANVPAYLNTLIRTNTFEALNEARYAAYTDPALGNFVVALEYSAILDDRTTEICQALDGGTYSVDSEVWERYRPPNHYNCRSLLIPITVTDRWDGVESPPPTVEPQEGFK